MRVTIELMAQLRVAFGAPEWTADLEGTVTLRDALRTLVLQLAGEADGSVGTALISADGILASTVIASRDGQALDRDGSVVLADGDTITLFCPIAGG